jgi:hypothetical protein
MPEDWHAAEQEIKKLTQELQSELQRNQSTSSTRADTESSLVSLRAENKRLNESLQHTESVLEQMKRRCPPARASSVMPLHAGATLHPSAASVLSRRCRLPWR